jgi:hypothetical protein
MKNFKNHRKLEKGQIIPVVVFAMIALIAMAALILDGSSIMLNRRTAQNAADAGALAGARVMCRDDDATQAEIYNAVYQYTTVENNATLVSWEITDENVGVVNDLRVGEVLVTAEIENNSFFAKIFNQDTLTAQASAGAGCFTYGPEVVLPIAYPCYTPLYFGESEYYIKSEDCDYAMLEWDYFDSVARDTCGMAYNPLLEGVTPTETEAECIRTYLYQHHPDMIYVVVNEEKMCAKDPTNYDPTNELLCALTAEGHYQLTGSSRGWLNLSDGSAGTSVLRNWIMAVNNPTLHTHIWLSFIGGTRAEPVFTDLEKRLFDVVYIPVFNHVCDHAPLEGDLCWQEAHAEIPDIEDVCEVIHGSPGNDFGHVVAFAPYFTTCVRQKGAPQCDGFDRALELNPIALEKTDYSFEGYFVAPQYLENPEDVSLGGADLGLYTASLTR